MVKKKYERKNGIRTRGLQFGKLMLYQLSYFRLSCLKVNGIKHK